MAPIATADTALVDATERIGQLKLNAVASPVPSTSNLAQAEKKVRVVDPFNYVVSRKLSSPSFYSLTLRINR
jgi:hypothetical protein